jgi:hypothetical protein
VALRRTPVAPAPVPMPIPLPLLMLGTAIGVAACRSGPPPGTTAPTASDRVTARLELITHDGKPRAGTVQLARLDGEELLLVPATEARPVRFAVTDFAHDHIVLRDLPRGRFAFVLEVDDHARTISSTVELGAEPVRIKLALPRGATLTGTVQDERGEPIAGATVTSGDAGGHHHDHTLDLTARVRLPRLSLASTTTDRDGRFVLPHLALGSYTLRAGHPDWCPTQENPTPLQVEGERRDVGPLVLQRGASITGRIVDGGRNRYQLELCRASGGQLTTCGSTFTARDGTFSFPPRMPAGDYRLVARIDDQEPPFASGSDFGSLSTTVRIAAGQRDVEVMLQARVR